jgi:hypothetical protein
MPLQVLLSELQSRVKSASLHRSQISENLDFKEYVIDAGSGSSMYRFFHFKNRLFKNRPLNGREAGCLRALWPAISAPLRLARDFAG